MNLFLLTERVEFQQRLQMLPTSQTPYSPNVRVGHVSQAVPVAIAERGALDMGRFDFAAGVDDFALVVDEGLADVQRVVVVL